jgi:hypothetical protein
MIRSIRSVQIRGFPCIVLFSLHFLIFYGIDYIRQVLVFSASYFPHYEFFLRRRFGEMYFAHIPRKSLYVTSFLCVWWSISYTVDNYRLF